jgi:hypothetical protein
MSENCIKTGAIVYLIDYQRFAPADIFAVADARLLKFGRDPLNLPGWHVPVRKPTHTLYLNRHQNYWRQADGIAVVYHEDLIDFDALRDLGRTL